MRMSYLSHICVPFKLLFKAYNPCIIIMISLFLLFEIIVITIAASFVKLIQMHIGSSCTDTANLSKLISLLTIYHAVHQDSFILRGWHIYIEDVGLHLILCTSSPSFHSDTPKVMGLVQKNLEPILVTVTTLSSHNKV